ncbi:DUF6221 family protein [Streptomyces chartreusis]|jgi:hypothetical protein|uniref:DUF6221 family protein n=1 Tax=Streptomyces chartreusis TaxID=1969 RepID=UPI0037DC30E6|nr:DUF6221 family protein [Streptomyces chartreusis]
MTAQGEDILAWLDAAITRVEATARATMDRQPYDEWDAVGDDREGDTARKYWSVVNIAQMYPTPAARDLAIHIAMHDPESVLRRCAADRKLLELHAPQQDGSGIPDALQCRTCSQDGGDGYRYLVYAPCPTVLAIAEGYGWTEGER